MKSDKLKNAIADLKRDSDLIIWDGSRVETIYPVIVLVVFSVLVFVFVL